MAGSHLSGPLFVGGVPISTLLAGPFVGNAYYVDPANGSDSNAGTDITAPLKTVLAAYNKTVDAHNDVVFLIGSSTENNPAAALAWSKSFTHLVGLSADIPGVGQRCRIVTQAGVAASQVITISGTGCIFRNIQFNNEKASGAAAGVAIVSGHRNYFENCFFMAPTANDAASFSLKVGSSENVFYRCTIGQFTNFRANASYGLWLHGAAVVSRNKFIKCEFLSWGSGGAGHDHVHVLVDAEITVTPWVTWFEDCLFHNNYGGGTILAQAIDDNSTATGHQIVFRGHNDILGCTLVGDTLTYMFAPNPEDDVSGLLMVTVAES
jgi:hypothetical protein